MANELNQITVDSTGTSWVDSVPGVTSAGYQSQNTNITARTVGQDLSSVRVSGTDIIVDISGPIDIDGLPFSLTSAVTLTPSTGGVFYIQVISGATSIQKSLELTSSVPVWDASKNALYNGGNRVLNWVVYVISGNYGLLKIYNPESFTSNIGSVNVPNNSNQFVRVSDLGPIIYPFKKSSFTGPTSSCYGLAFDGTNLLSCSSSTVYIHSGISNTISSSFSTPASIRGMTFANGNVILCSSISTIYVMDGKSSSVLTSFSVQSTLDLTLGITFDGNNLIGASSIGGGGGLGKIAVFDGISSSVLTTFSSPSNYPSGLAYDGKNLISGDYSSDLIHVHNGITADTLSSFDSPGTTPTGLTIANGNLFSGYTTTSKIYKNGL